MNTYRTVTTSGGPVRLEITRSGGARLPDARGALLTVQQGSVWITQDGSSVDICVDAGQSYRIECDGLTLVSAIAPATHARVTLAAPDRPRSFVTRMAAFAERLASAYKAPARRAIHSV